MKDELRSLSLAIILSFIAIYSVNSFFGTNKTPQQQLQVAEIEQAPTALDETTISSPAAKIVFETTDEAIKNDERINFSNSSVKGSIKLIGSRFDNLKLEKYNASLDNEEEKIELLTPQKTMNPYFAEFGWLSLDKSISLPNANSKWTSDNTEITSTKPAILTWNNNKGIKFIRKISLDDNYLFTITDTVENLSGEDIELFPYGLISKSVTDNKQSRSVVHEGISAVVSNTLKEFKYTDIEDGENKSLETKRGWIGFSDRYWFSAIITQDKAKNKITIKNNITASVAIKQLIAICLFSSNASLA